MVDGYLFGSTHRGIILPISRKEGKNNRDDKVGKVQIKVQNNLEPYPRSLGIN